MQRKYVTNLFVVQKSPYIAKILIHLKIFTITYNVLVQDKKKVKVVRYLAFDLLYYIQYIHVSTTIKISQMQNYT